MVRRTQSDRLMGILEDMLTRQIGVGQTHLLLGLHGQLGALWQSMQQYTAEEQVAGLLEVIYELAAEFQ